MASMLDALQGVPNASFPLPHLATAGQPSAAAFAAFRDAGGEVVLDIRDPMEPRPFDEADVVRGLGLEYVNVSVRQGALDDAVMDRVLDAVRSSAGKGRTLLFHCASANRVGGALIPYFILDQGMAEEEAVDAAMRVGLRGADLLEWGLDYARRKQEA
jgi:rhodanese-related sulfurtransferase